jgi:hypothetical protein
MSAAMQERAVGRQGIEPRVEVIGVGSMMSLLAVLHTIAAQRGEGLLPELISLLKHSKAGLEAECVSVTSESYDDRRIAPSGSDLAPSNSDSVPRKMLMK